jgi:hypothetical protein
VELEYLDFPEPLADEMRAWLSELGESAADTVLRQIERETVPRRMKVIPKLSNAYFDLPDARLGVEGRERERA